MNVFLITGGAGFIGLNFIKYLMEIDNAYIVNLDKLTYAANAGEVHNLNSRKNYCFVKGDICDKEIVDSIFKQYKPDYIINFAAESHVDRSIDDSDLFIRTNIMGCHNLLNFSVENRVKKFIQISTDEVYGSSEADEEYSEASRIMPGNPYAASKAAADMLVLSFFNTYKLPAIITRCTNNFGIYQNSEKLIPMVIERCLLREGIPLYGDGRHMRDWLHVSDHCRAIYQVLLKGIPGQIYNISAGNEIENIKLINKIIEIVKNEAKDKDRINEGLIKYTADRKGHDRRYKINSDKIRLELGWEPQGNFDEALKKTIKWYMKLHRQEGI